MFITYLIARVSHVNIKADKVKHTDTHLGLYNLKENISENISVSKSTFLNSIIYSFSSTLWIQLNLIEFLSLSVFLWGEKKG